MSEISAALVKELRDATNVSMMECKRALTEAGGDKEQAIKLLRQRGMSVAASKASRAANQGLVASATADGGKTVSLLEVNCETDFVARNENFKAFVDKLAVKACGTDGDLAAQVKDEVAAKIVEIGENVVVRRSVRFVLKDKGAITSYIHLGGKVGVIIELGCTKDESASSDIFKELLKDLSLQVAASAPRFLTSADIPAAELASEREIFLAQIKDKPPQIAGKIVDGKIKKFYSDVCLVDQPFVKEVKQSISALLAAKGKELGDTLTIRRFARYQIGK
jgi:elongation factor Ts